MNHSEQEDKIHIYDLNGGEIMIVPVQGPMTVVEVSGLNSGLYLVKAGNRVGRFIKE